MNDNWDTYKLCKCNYIHIFMGFFLIEYANVYFLISVRVSCRYNSTDIFLHTSKTDGKSRVIISQRKSKNRNSETHRAEKKNRTADISRYRIDQGTFTETIITRCMYYIRPVISSDILLILIEQMYGYKKRLLYNSS